jgi:hypothetical protein
MNLNLWDIPAHLPRIQDQTVPDEVDPAADPIEAITETTAQATEAASLMPRFVPAIPY